MRHRIKRSSVGKAGFLLALLATMAFVIAACGGDDDDDSDTASDGGGEVTEVAIGTQPWIGYGPFWIADEQGFDTDHGVDIKLVNFSTDQDLESGFASGKFQAANNANNTLIRLADLGLDYKIVLMEDVSLEADAVLSCNPDIQSIEDVEGAKVAFEEFSVSDVLFRYALNEAGVDFESIDYTRSRRPTRAPRPWPAGSTSRSPTSRICRPRSRRATTARSSTRRVRTRA